MSSGVSGRVIKLVGNHMPSVGAPPSGTTHPQSNIEVVALATSSLSSNQWSQTPSSELKALGTFCQSATTDQDGYYSMPLEPGKHYTVLAILNNKPYLNSFTREGYWTSVEVASGAFKTWDIVDTSEAYF